MRLYAREMHEELPPFCRKFSTGWAMRVVKSVEKKKSVAGQFAVKYRSGTNCWNQKLYREDFGVHKYWVLLAVVKEYTLLRFNKHCAFTWPILPA